MHPFMHARTHATHRLQRSWSLTTQCVLRLQNVFSYYTMCSLTTDCKGVGFEQHGDQGAGGTYAHTYKYDICVHIHTYIICVCVCVYIICVCVVTWCDQGAGALPYMNAKCVCLICMPYMYVYVYILYVNAK